MSKLFNRYECCEIADAAIQMPSDVIGANVQSSTIGELILRLEDISDLTKNEMAKYPWAKRFVMGYPLPEWQRPVVWTKDQNVKFITSIWSGVDLGSYLVNDVWEFIDANPKNGDFRFREFSDVLLDGQQRLTAIQSYLMGQFSVPDATGVERYWSDLPKLERRRFSAIKFTKAYIRTWDEDKLRLAYDLRSFGGTAHTEEQRATKIYHPNDQDKWMMGL
jgi:hypothetical protein